MGHIQSLNRRTGKRSPFWLPASSFYFLVAGLATASFFLVIGVLHNDGREPEIVVAGLAASGVLVLGAVLREIVLRNARERFIAERKMLDMNLKTAPTPLRDDAPRKLTLERNAAAIQAIRMRSEAAMVFEKIAQGHREVFEMCAEYRKLVATEMRNIHPNSPRLKPLIKGNEYALKTHKFHILRWAELESRSLAGEAKQSSDPTSRADVAERAKRPLELALRHYPDEPALKDSLDVLDELVFTLRIRAYIDDAETAEATGDLAVAEMIYIEAIEQLDKNEPGATLLGIREQIEQALGKLGSDRN